MTKIITTPNTTSGYSLRTTDENGTTTTPIIDIVDDGKTLKLPANPSNRKYFSIKKVQDAGGEIELTYKESIHLSPKSEKSEKPAPANKTSDLSRYLEGEDKIAYEALIKKALRNKAIEEARKRMVEAQAEVDRLMAEMNENEEEEEA